MHKESSIRDEPQQDRCNKPKIEEEDTRQMIEMAAEQLADLIWRHWLYMQEQKKEKRLNVPDS